MQVTYSTLMEGYARQGDVSKCKLLVEQMHNAGLHPNALIYNILLHVAVLHPVPDMQVRILMSTRLTLHVTCTIHVPYPCTVRTCCCSHLPRVHQIRHLQPCLAFAASSEPTRACMQAAGPVLKAMAEDGHAPGVDTVNTLMQAALKAGLPGAVPGLFRQLLQAGLSPSALSHLALITALTRLDRSADAVRLALVRWHALVWHMALHSR